MTSQQREALSALRESERPLTPDELAKLIGTTANGAASTGSSLVRNGLARRIRRGGKVSYEAIVR